MGEIEWPAGIDRTPQDDREKYPHGFEVSRREAIEHILEQLRKMDATDKQIDTAADHQSRNPNLPYSEAKTDDPGIVVRYKLDGTPHIVAMDKWTRLRDNARAVGLTLEAKRALTRYGVESIESEFSTHRLPPGDDDAMVSGPPPHEILEVDPDASDEVIEAAARQKKREHHPDAGGDEQAFKRVVEAEEAMLDA
ncbi:MAG: DnaJ domain-containing protein [Halodesulfurarchaeum sp.]